MSAQTIHELLPIPPGTAEPHPYQVLGLEVGTRDPKAIARAVQSAATRLKEVKAATEPKLWKQAAYLVKRAQETLTDPSKKAELDARFGIVTSEATTTWTAPSISSANSLDDPLAGLLPEGDPFAPPPERTPTPPEPAPTQLKRSRESIAPPPTSLPLPPAIVESEFIPAAASPLAIQPVEVVAPRPRRRRRSLAGPVAFAAFVFASIGIIGTLVYLRVFKPGQQPLVIADVAGSMSPSSTSTSGAVVVGTQRSVESGDRRPPRDAIMGNLGRGEAAPATRRQPSGLTAGLSNPQPTDSMNNGESPESIPMEMAMPDPASEPAKPEPDATELSQLTIPPMEPVAMPTVPMDAPATVPMDAPAMVPLSEEAIAEAEQSLQQVRDLLRSADWKQMKPAAEAALEKPMSDAQKASAEALFELADLASYYRVGIEKAVAELKIGNDFEVTDNFRVIVVEAGENKLVVRFDAKNRSFTLDELPWSLAHKLATFSVPDNPTSQAAKAVYQAIAPKSSDAYREQSLQWLDQIQGEIEGADAGRVAETLRSLYAQP